MAKKHYFAPVPNRAFFDARLDRLHLRLLGVIAMHDRMGVNGRHCTLSVRRLGEKIGVDFSNVAAAIRELVEWNLLSRLPHPSHRQRQQLALIYDDAADLEVVSQNRGAVDPRLSTVNRGAVDPHRRYPPKGDRKYAAEAAPEPTSGSGADAAFSQKEDEQGDRPPQSYGEYLGRLERSIREGASYTPRQLEIHYATLTGIADAHEPQTGDAIGGWAYRLAELVAELMDEPTWERVVLRGEAA